MKKITGAIVAILIVTAMSSVFFYPYAIGRSSFVNVYKPDSLVLVYPIYQHIVDLIINGSFKIWDFNIATGNNIFVYSNFIFDPFILVILLLKSNILFGMMVAVYLKLILICVIIYYFLSLC